MTTKNTKAWQSATLGAMAPRGAGAARVPGRSLAQPPRQFLPDMDDSPKWKPQTQSEFYSDGRAMRQPVAGTVPFGQNTDASDPGRVTYLKEDVTFLHRQGRPGQHQGPAGVTWWPPSPIRRSKRLRRPALPMTRLVARRPWP